MAAMYLLDPWLEKVVQKVGNENKFMNLVIPRSAFSVITEKSVFIQVLWPVAESVTPFQQFRTEYNSNYFYIRNEFQNEKMEDFEVLELKAPRNETIKIYYKPGVPDVPR